MKGRKVYIDNGIHNLNGRSKESKKYDNYKHRKGNPCKVKCIREKGRNIQRYNQEAIIMPEKCIGSEKGVLTETDIKRFIEHLENYRFYISQFRSEPDKSVIIKVIDSDLHKLKAIF